MHKTLAILKWPFWLYLVNQILNWLGYLEHVDFIIGKFKDPSWIRSLMEYFLYPAPIYVQIPAFVFGGYLLFYWLHIRNKTTQVVQQVKRNGPQTDGAKVVERKARIVQQFKDLVFKFINCFCDLIVIEDELLCRPSQDTSKKCLKIENSFNKVLNDWKVIAERCGIAEFEIELENPRIGGAAYTEKQTINSAEEARFWVFSWFDYYQEQAIEGEEAVMKLKNTVRGSINSQEKTYLDNNKDKMTEERYEATNS